MSRLKTWVAINQKALFANVNSFYSLLRPVVKIWAVIKSNAYGHGLLTVASLLKDAKEIGGFCVDSVVEGLALRENGVKKPILVLGPTLPNFLKSARSANLLITISNWDALAAAAKIKNPPAFHLKVDTGMHRQGFYISALREAARMIKKKALPLEGVYTHFASAKDLNYPTYTEYQFSNFQKALAILDRSGFKKLKRHVASTAGTLMDSKYHLDFVRVGIGLYGLWPSKELMLQKPSIKLKPVLSWHSIVSEVKQLKAGDFVGYDLVERVRRPTQMAIVPIGYWHGFPRNLSAVGEVLINGRRAKVLGRVSMDLISVDADNIHCRVGDKVTLIGKQGKEEITAFDLAQKLGTVHYELVTRINPLIERVVV